jgi:rubrerythrin
VQVHEKEEIKMDKYQKALNRIVKFCDINNGSVLEDDLKTLQELVDKVTPKKPKKIIDDFDDYAYEYYFCPNCENEVNDTYCPSRCPSCGQALKWND